MAEMGNSQQISIEINKVVKNGVILMTPDVSGLSDGNYQYQVKLVKQGLSGKSTSSQSGNFSVLNKVASIFSSSKINLEPEDQCQFSVNILKEDESLIKKTFDCALK